MATATINTMGETDYFTSLPGDAQQCVRLALQEDLGQGDCTTDAIPELAFQSAVAVLSTRQQCVVSGLEAAAAVFQQVDNRSRITLNAANGQRLQAGDALLTVSGTTASLLKAERLALNVLQHACGVATHTQAFAELVAQANPNCTVVHTRKTLPGLRWLENQAVVDGGGGRHRYNLGMAAMVKDNHVAACHGDIQAAAVQVKAALSHTQTLTVEVDTLAQIEPALAGGADVLLLDNMSPEVLTQAVKLINGRAVAEASGGVTLNTIAEIAQTGVNVISTSQLTMAAPPIDIGMELHAN